MIGILDCVNAALVISGNALRAQHGNEEFGHFVANTAAVFYDDVRVYIHVDCAEFELLVVFEAADVFGNGFDVLQLGLLGVPEFLGLGNGVGGVPVVAPGGGDQVGREVGVDGFDVEAVFVLDVVALAVRCVVGDGVLVFAGAASQGGLDAVALGDLE